MGDGAVEDEDAPREQLFEGGEVCGLVHRWLAKTVRERSLAVKRAAALFTPADPLARYVCARDVGA